MTDQFPPEVAWENPLFRSEFAGDFADALTARTDATLAPRGSAQNEEPPAWAPTVQDVADLSPAYTRGPIDGDTPSSGGERLTFTDETDPTVVQVQAIIDASVQDVAGRVGMGVDWLSKFPDLSRRATAWLAAATIEAEKAPEAAPETSGAYQWKQSSFVADLNELISQARRQAMRLW